MDNQLQTLSEDQHFLLETLNKEYVMGMHALNSLGAQTFTFYGGHRVKSGESSYKLTQSIAHQLALKNWGIISGGGPGIMQAALDGAKAGGGSAIAFRINIANEAVSQEDNDVSIMFSQFSVRKYMLRQSDAFAFAPGGFGTLDELMELLTLLAVNKYPKKPIFLLDSEFWKGYIEWFDSVLFDERNVLKAPIHEYITLADSSDEVLEHLYSNNPNNP